MKQADLALIADAISASMPPSHERDKIALYIVEAIVERYPALNKERFWQALTEGDEVRWERMEDKEE